MRGQVEADIERRIGEALQRSGDLEAQLERSEADRKTVGCLTLSVSQKELNLLPTLRFQLKVHPCVIRMPAWHSKCSQTLARVHF